MSERGSYVTQYMYRHESERARIKAALEEALKLQEPILVNVPPVDVCGDNKIIAGYYRLLPGSSGEELVDFQYEVGPRLAKELSKPLRVAVLCDEKEGAIFCVYPDGRVERLCGHRGLRPQQED